MRSTTKAFVSCLLLLGVVGCSSVVSIHPLGEPVSANRAKRLEGVWLTSEGDPCHLRHLDKNELRLGWVQWEEKKFKMAELSVFVTTDDGQQYLNVFAKEVEQDEGHYSIFRLVNDDKNLMVLTLPNVDVFEKAVNDGELAGKVEKKRNTKHVTLNSSKQEIDDFVHPDQVAQQFEIDPSLILRRIKFFHDE